MTGKVYLVGAGPGDEGLITVRGQQLLKEAEVVIYDYLSNPSLLRHCDPTCEKIYVGKSAGHHTMKQEAINALLVEKGKAGKKVVRLKGGDPYVFGRGGEEGHYLAMHGIDFEVVPGITSAIGGLAYGGIPITHRDCASSFHVFTGHLKDSEKDLDWPTIAKLEGTLVFLMGVRQLAYICERLIEYGKSHATPMAIIYKATTPEQKIITGNLGNMVEIAEQEQVKPPSLIVIGEVVTLHNTLHWFQKRPLFGQHIVVTRSREKASVLSEKLKEAGALPIEFPMIQTIPDPHSGLNQALAQLKKYTYLILTSETAVHLFFKQLCGLGKDSRSLAYLKIVAIGNTTKEALGSYGIIPDIVPKKATAEGVVMALKEVVNQEDVLLLPRSKQGRAYLVQALEALCQVEEIGLYDTLPTNENAEMIIEKLKEGRISAITFTSSTTVDYFMKAIGNDARHLLKKVDLVTIGPITSNRLKGYGFHQILQAKEATIDGLVNILIEKKEE